MEHDAPEIHHHNNDAPLSFEGLLRRYEKPIFNYAYRLLARREDAEDIVQNTFLNLYRHWRRIDPEQNVKAFIYKIATHEAYDLLRKRRRATELFIIDDPDVRFETIDRESPYSSVEMDADIGTALGKISPLYRSVLLLFYKEDFTYEQIASLLALPINTVKTRIRRAKQALREHLVHYDA